MKRYIKCGPTSITANEDYKLPSGWVEKTKEELIDLGYDMREEFLKEDEAVCKENGVILLGYAINDDDEFALVVRDEASRKIMVCESSNGRLYPVED